MNNGALNNSGRFKHYLKNNIPKIRNIANVDCKIGIANKIQN